MPKGVYNRDRLHRRLSPEVLATHAFIAKYIFDNGMPPTVSEIAAGRHLSVAAVGRHLVRLDEREIIEPLVLVV